jgi:hypothetical protein
MRTACRARTARSIAGSRELAWDLESPIRLERTFDLAISMEVAEHLSPGRAPSFVDDLTGLAAVVLFSTAIPGPGGIGHINEPWVFCSGCSPEPWRGRPGPASAASNRRACQWRTLRPSSDTKSPR